MTTENTTEGAEKSIGIVIGVGVAAVVAVGAATKWVVGKVKARKAKKAEAKAEEILNKDESPAANGAPEVGDAQKVNVDTKQGRVERFKAFIKAKAKVKAKEPVTAAEVFAA